MFLVKDLESTLQSVVATLKPRPKQMMLSLCCRELEIVAPAKEGSDEMTHAEGAWSSAIVTEGEAPELLETIPKTGMDKSILAAVVAGENGMEGQEESLSVCLSSEIEAEQSNEQKQAGETGSHELAMSCDHSEKYDAGGFFVPPQLNAQVQIPEMNGQRSGLCKVPGRYYPVLPVLVYVHPLCCAAVLACTFLEFGNVVFADITRLGVYIMWAMNYLVFAPMYVFPFIIGGGRHGAQLLSH